GKFYLTGCASRYADLKYLRSACLRKAGLPDEKEQAENKEAQGRPVRERFDQRYYGGGQHEAGGGAPTTTFCRPHTFPGKGDYQKWLAGDRFYTEGNKLLDFDQKKQAFDKYVEAVVAYPFDFNFYNNLGITQLMLEDFPAAETTIRNELQLE